MFGNKRQNLINSFSIPKTEDCFAKTFYKGGYKKLGHTVLSHCMIVGLVARELINRMPNWLQEALFPPGVELVAAAHDVGKISPAFQKKIYEAVNLPTERFPGLEHIRVCDEENWGYHQGVSQIAAKGAGLGEAIARILGRHHGRIPQTNFYKDGHESLGDISWSQGRKDFFQLIRTKLQADWPVIDSHQEPIIAGLTSVSDWIGSGPSFEDPNLTVNEDFVSSVLDQTGFHQPKLRSNLSFKEVFGFSPLPAQEVLIEKSGSPGVYILEAPMGYGKTEAALYVAYQMLLKNQARGIYFALPTQLSSNSIYDRVQKFLHQICESKEASRLLHSNADLHDFGEEGSPKGSWFDGNKRGILAPFAVGTLDQALLSVMHVRYGFIRAFGLSGKVVIIDEAHSYDLYTGTILDELIQQLLKWKCTVIILSATLSLERRQELIGSQVRSSSYPLVSSLIENKIQEHEILTPENTEVNIRCLSDEFLAFNEALNRAEEGQQVLWIENTVSEAQEIYQRLAAHCGDRNISCGLVHSRFLKTDRSKIENHWISILDKKGKSIRGQCGRILVGTQVLEQSLDIDADFLISRICPTDMILQRLGRLWRHSGTIRPPDAKREVWIMTPKDPSDLGLTGLIYAPYVIHRTLEVWSKLSSVFLPMQIRPLIELTYQTREEKDPVLERERKNLEKKKDQLRNMAIAGISQRDTEPSDEDATTRYSEIDTVEVLLIRSVQHHAHRSMVTLLDGERLELPRGECSNRRILGAKLKLNTLMVNVHQSIRQTAKPQLDWLEEYIYVGERNSCEKFYTLRVGIVEKDGSIKGLNGEEEPAVYDAKLGYRYGK